MRRTLLARLGADNDQTLLDHLQGVSARSAHYAENIGLRRAGELIGLLHDLGKASSAFQDYLRMPEAEQSAMRGKVDHSTAGALRLLEAMTSGAGPNDPAQIVARMLALCIASHHSGLVDCLRPDGSDGLRARLLATEERRSLADESWRQIDVETRTRIDSLAGASSLLDECIDSLRRLRAANGDRNVQLGLLIRFLFSCLVDADHTDTANFEKPQNARMRFDSQYASWELLARRIDACLSRLPRDGRVNDIRRQVSEQCHRAAAHKPGIYTLTAPTGSGKTLSALRYAIEHARIHNLERVIFVSPFISIVEQNAAVARRALAPESGEDNGVVLEHHSNLVSDFGDEAEGCARWRSRVLAENWDARIVFTTSAQALEALFGAGTRSVRRLHAMTRAVIVFDEAQTIPARMIHLFNNAVNLLVSHCRSSILLCTATQPLLADVDEQRGAAKLADAPELIADVHQLFADLKRVEVVDHVSDGRPWTIAEAGELVMQEARRVGNCLAIVNTKKEARDIYEQAEHGLGAAAVWHLSTAMCPAHRMHVFESMRRQLTTSSPSRPMVCVSTQLIEAGVDVDFASAVRDLAGLDSIAQAAGRCNRNGLSSKPGLVHVIALPEPGRGLEEIAAGRAVTRALLADWRRKHPGQPFALDDPQQMRSYYSRLFHERKDKNGMSYPISAEQAGRNTTLLELLGDNRQANASRQKERNDFYDSRTMLLQSFKTAAEAFCLIAQTQGVVAPYGEEGARIVNDLAAADDLDAQWRLLRKAQQFTVSLYPQQFRRMLDAGVIYAAGGGTGVYCLQPQHYDARYGLQEEAGDLEDLHA